MINKVSLRKGLEQCYSLAELKIVCFDLGVDYDVLSGESKPVKSLELIEYLDRRGKLDSLLAYCLQDRPGYAWEVPAVESHAAESASPDEYTGVMDQWQREIGIRIMQAAVVWVASGSPVSIYACGFIVEPRGFVVTVDFAITDPDHITVGWNNQEFSAELVARNTAATTALLRLKCPTETLFPALTMSATDAVSRSDKILLLGYTPELGWMNNTGEVIEIVTAEGEIPYIRTRVETKPGYAGAPVMNERGHIIGIHFGKDRTAQGELLKREIPIEYALQLLTSHL